MKTKIFSTIHENSTKNWKPNNQKIYPQPNFHFVWRHINNKLMSLVVYEDMKVVNIAKKIINRLNHYLLYLLISQPVKTTKTLFYWIIEFCRLVPVLTDHSIWKVLDILANESWILVNTQESSGTCLMMEGF